MPDDSLKPEGQQLRKSLADEEIVTERRSPRRSFLAVTGAALLAGGALVISGCGNDPDKTKSQKPPQTPAQEPGQSTAK